MFNNLGFRLMILSKNKLKRVLLLTSIFVVPLTLLFVHFFVLSNSNLKVTPKPKENVAKSEEIVEISIRDLDISAGNIFEKTGVASYYADKFHNRTTASGEVFNMHEFSAAHKSLPFGTVLRVTNLNTNKTTLVRINDRGPYIGNRIIDLSKRSAQAIGSIMSGTAKVKIEGFTNSKNVASNLNGEYVYAYTLENSPICVPFDLFTVIDSSNSFHYAVKSYKQLKKNDKNNEYYFLVNPNENQKFYIGKTKKIDASYLISDNSL